MTAKPSTLDLAVTELERRAAGGRAARAARPGAQLAVDRAGARRTATPSTSSTCATTAPRPGRTRRATRPWRATSRPDRAARVRGRSGVVGHSMGGKAAMTLALTRPELVERLVVVDIAPVRYRQGYEDYVRAMLAVDLAAVARRADADAALPRGPGRRPCAASCSRTSTPPTAGSPGSRTSRSCWRTMPALTGFPAELAGRVFRGPAWCLRGEKIELRRGRG